MTGPPDDYYVPHEPEEPPDPNVWRPPPPPDNPYTQPPFGSPTGGWPRPRRGMGAGASPLGFFAGLFFMAGFGWLCFEIAPFEFMAFGLFGSMLVAGLLIAMGDRYWKGFGAGMVMAWGLVPVVFVIACFAAFPA